MAPTRTRTHARTIQVLETMNTDNADNTTAEPQEEPHVEPYYQVTIRTTAAILFRDVVPLTRAMGIVDGMLPDALSKSQSITIVPKRRPKKEQGYTRYTQEFQEKEESQEESFLVPHYQVTIRNSTTVEITFRDVVPLSIVMSILGRMLPDAFGNSKSITIVPKPPMEDTTTLY